MAETLYCPYCGSDQLIPFPKVGPGWYQCQECFSVFNNPIIIDDMAKQNDTE